MRKAGEKNIGRMSRRDMIKTSGLTLGGIAAGGIVNGLLPENGHAAGPNSYDPTQQNTLFESLEAYSPGTEELAPDEMRITFLGTSCIPRLSQMCNSIFVEVGNALGEPDQFVFDCGSGVMAKYNAMGIPLSKMDKIFLTHLHGDHVSDMTHIYCFGPSVDRKSPMYVWGPGPSGVLKPSAYGRRSLDRYFYDDGTRAFCESLRNTLRWHTESFSFETTSYASYVPPTRESWGLPHHPVPVGDDAANDAYAIVPIELDWTKSGPNDNVAYHNPNSGVRITHFPAIHCRKGSISYKLEWNGLSMIFTGDTKPNYDLISQAAGVDVLIHEMVVPASVWAMKALGITDPSQVPEQLWQAALENATAVQNSSHTPQGAFGYLLTQISPRPRLTVATHFQAADDTIWSALQSVRAHVPNIACPQEITWAADFMVLNVARDAIRQRRAVVSMFTFTPIGRFYADQNQPKYPDAYAQIDTTRSVPAVDPLTGKINYREDGY